MLIIWILVFVASLAVMLKGSDWLLESAEKIGVAIGLSPFIVGVLLVGVGTSFPELVSSIFAVVQGATDIVVANAIGSNIANILLVIGLSAVVARKLVVTKSLIDLDLPLVALATVLILGIVRDGVVLRTESILLVVAYIVYFFYILSEQSAAKEKAQPHDVVEIIPAKKQRALERASRMSMRGLRDPSSMFRQFLLLIVGIAGLALGAKYLIDSVIAISEIIGIATGAIALAAVAFGTSLPEVLVSIKAARQGKSEVALGNIFGSNVFNVLAVVGIPGLFSTLEVSTQTLAVGVPTLIAATVLFVISGISKRIYKWEGMMYVIIYLFFLGSIFGIF